MKTKTTHDRLIGRLPEADRLALLDAIASSTHGTLIAVEHSYERQLETAKTTVGRITAVAYSPSGGCSTVLVLKPADQKLRNIAISAAHVLRIRMATPWPAMGPEAHKLGEVIAGPPLKNAADR